MEKVRHPVFAQALELLLLKPFPRYPVDNGAFGFNSTLLGHDLPAPRFWPTNTK